MRAWHHVEPKTAQSHPLYGRSGWLAIFFVSWALYVLMQVDELSVLPSLLAEMADDERFYFVLASIVVLAGLMAYLVHTLYIGLRKIPVPEGNSKFDARFPRRMKIFLGLYLLFGFVCMAYGFNGPSHGLAFFHFELEFNGVPILPHEALGATIYYLYFKHSRRVRVTYLNQVHVYDPFLKTAEVLDPEPLTSEMICDRHLLSAVMNSAVPADIRTDIESKWADDAKKGQLGKRARDYLIEIHEAYLGPYTAQSA